MVSGNNELVTGGTVADAINDAVTSSAAGKADLDAGNIDVDKWRDKLGQGKVEAGNKGFINGGQVFDVKQDLDAAIDKNAKEISRLDKNLGDPAKDASDKRNGADTPAGADGLNGASVNDKANALRRGEAGSMVYTDAEGNRVSRAMDGKLYKTDDIDGTTRMPLAGVKAVNPEKVGGSLVNAEGSTTDPIALHNVAAGRISADSTDAVNGGQLFGVMDQANANRLAIGDLDRKVNGTAALGAAIAALKPLDYDPLEQNQIMAGIGHYRGQTGFALGVAHHENNDLMLHGELSYNGTARTMVSGGISFRFGQKKKSSQLNQQDTIKVLKNQVAEQAKEIQELKQMMLAMMNKK